MTTDPQGDRGDRGDRGVSGERGPKGDHGQHGSEGATGATGERGAEGRSTRAVQFFLTIAFVTFTLWMGEKDSCKRQTGSREATRIVASAAFEARTASAQAAREKGDWAQARTDQQAADEYERAIEAAASLDCGGLFPDTE